MTETYGGGSEDLLTTLAAERDDAFSTVAFLACVMAAVIASVYWVARAGFDNPALPILKAFALSLLLTTAPFVIRFAFRMNARPYRWATSYSFLWLAILLATALLGWAVPIVGLNPFPLLAALGIAGFALVTKRFFQSRSASECLLLVVGAALFAASMAGVVWGRIYKNPLFVENLTATGVVHHDTLFIAALTNMLRTYGIASTGLNGLPYIPYHWGSAWLFAQWSNLIDSSVLDFYQLAFAVTMIPLFFGGVLALASEITCSQTRDGHVGVLRGRWVWIFFLAASIGVLPIESMDALGVWTSNLVISESYAVAVPVGLLLLSTTVVFWRGSAAGGFRSGRGLTLGEIVFLMAVLPVGIALLGYLKISVMVLAFGVAMYIALRIRLYRRPVGIASMLVGTILFAIAYHFVSLPAHNQGMRPFDFVRDYVPRMWWFFFPVVHLLWTWLYIALRLVQERISTLTALWENLKARRLLDVEVVLFVALAGLAPGLIMHIDGGSAFYFSDVQRWLALGLLMATVPLGFGAFTGRRRPILAEGVRRDSIQAPGSSRIGSIRITRAAAVFVALPLLVTIALNALYWPKRFAQANAATRESLYPAMLRTSIPSGIHGLPRLGDAELLREGLLRSRNFRVVEQLRRLSSLDLADRRRTALFIPQTERGYWDLLARPGDCSFSSFVAPALSTMGMIDGMPPFGCTLSPFYGLGEYAPRRKPQSDTDASIATVCNKALSNGFERVIVLHFDTSASMTPTSTDCRLVSPAGRQAASGGST